MALNRGSAGGTGKRDFIRPGKGVGAVCTAGGILQAIGVVAVIILLMGIMAAPLLAQSYPSRPVRLILPFPPGGATDILGRIIGQKFAERLGQPFVAENRPGAGGNIGLELTAQAKPDGYTIVLSSPAVTISPGLYKKLNYDPIRDLAPIAQVLQGHYVLLVRPSLPVKTLKEFVEYAKARPGPGNSISGPAGSARRTTWRVNSSRALPRSALPMSLTRGSTRP